MENKAKSTLVNEFFSDSWIHITDEEFKQLRDLVYKNIGINLTEEKRNLLMGRLQKILRQKGFDNFSSYYNFVISDKSGDALSELANSISTNHTFFYREKDHFEFFLEQVLPEFNERLLKENVHDFRLWSAGCSSGEEPYNIVMLMKEYFGAEYKKWDAGVLATDISEKALETARKAIYSDDRIKYLPPNYKKKYFKSIDSANWEVVDDVKSEVTFRRFNLMNQVFPFKKKFHVIFCRNVMIYFDEQTRITLVNKFYDLLVPGGYLFIGHSETLKREVHKFQFVMPALYRKPLK
jgi:chemotaxis protein methyltransferase CheR